MEIKKASKKYSSQISKLMLEDLKNPDKRFPKEMIQKFREHASVEIITSEFSNPNLISFLYWGVVIF